LGLVDAVKNNVVVFFLGTLVTGFAAGIETYTTHLAWSGQEQISKEEHGKLVASIVELKKNNDELQNIAATSETRAKQCEEKAPSLEGAIIHVVTSAAAIGPKGNEAILSLKNFGAAITTYTNDTNWRIEPGSVIYYKPEKRAQALLALKILKPLGINRTTFAEPGPGPTGYLDVRFGPE
jgi:hypothetical protein